MTTRTMPNLLRRLFEGASIPLLSIVLGLTAASIFVLIAGSNPIDTYQRLFCEGFGPQGCATFGDLFFINVPQEDGGSTLFFAPTYGGGSHRLAVVVERMTPLILTALSATVAFQAGMFSIGMDGQFVLGAVVVAFLGVWLPQQFYSVLGTGSYNDTPAEILTILHLVVPAICLAAAMAVGAFYSWIAGYLKVKLNVNVLISTIILNAIAVRLVGYLVNFPLRSPDPNSVARTVRIDDTAWLIPFNRALLPDVQWLSGARVGVGLLIALAAAVLVWLYLWRSTMGYEQRMVRGSSLFARFGGIPSDRAALRAMLLSGALSGLAGAIAILGVERRVVDGFANSGTGFDGVLVAILARESIFGVLLVAPFYAGLQQGSVNLQFGNLPRQLGGIIIAFIILFSSMETFLRTNLTRVLPKRRYQPTPSEVKT
jgi:ABC-type uncharacterized transport system permease subunit